MGRGVDLNERVLVLGRAATDRFGSTEWTEVGYLTGTIEWINGHGRLLRSLRFGDGDYGEHCFDGIRKILTSSDENLGKLIAYEPMREWLQTNNPGKLSELQADAIGGDAVLTTTGPEPGDHNRTRYVLGEIIGRGGFGTVYRATRSTTVADFDCALKLFDPSAFVENKERALERFKRETSLLQRMQHRAIVPYIDAGIDAQGRPFLVMPLIEGMDLREWASANLRGVPRAMRELLGGLIYAHSNGVLHRDLKPSNIRVRTNDEQVIVLDFGCAYFLDQADANSLTTTMVGSLGYIPPEVVANPKLRSEKHDVFACGVMLFELLAGHRPDLSEYEPLAEIDPSFAQFDAIVLAATAPQSTRIGSIRELLARFPET